jgi:MoxR-like ATPase
MKRRTSKSTAHASAPAANSAAPSAESSAPVSTPALLTRPLGLLGWDKLEPVLLAALATAEPLLLIGRHGTAKSFLLERLAQALGLTYRFYNASLLNYDDLVGIPVPDAAQTSLRYISTPTAVWDAEVVFIDELSRTRPDLQNKLFSIIHERRVQGIPLEKLRYRWAAMNPPPGVDSGDHDEENDAYLGAEPLDPALADRFAFLLEVPGWADLTTAEKEELLADQFRGRHEFPVDVPALVTRTRERLALLTARPPALASYFIALETQLRAAGTRFSSRRISMLLRSALGIHAARGVLAAGSAAAPDWETSLFLAVAHGHPGLAAGSIDRGALLALHRQAWNLARLDPDDPWRTLLGLTDPVERVAAASLGHLPLKESDLSSLVLEAVAAQPGPEERAAVSLVLYLHLRETPRITAAAAETLAGQLTRVLRPAIDTHQVHGRQLTLCREVASLCAGLGDSPRDAYARNLLNAFLPAGFTGITPARLLTRFRALWDRFQLTAAAPAP